MFVPTVQIEAIFFLASVGLVRSPIGVRQILLHRSPDPLAFIQFIAARSPVKVLRQSCNNNPQYSNTITIETCARNLT